MKVRMPFFLLSVMATIVASACKDRSEALLKNESVTKKYPEARLRHTGGADWNINIPTGCDLKGENCSVTSGTPVVVSWRVASNYFDIMPDCSELTKTQQVPLKVSERDKNYGTLALSIEPKLFSRCEDSQARHEGGKVSFQCLNSGTWNGPMRLEVCAKSPDGKVIAQGWGLPLTHQLEQPGLSLASVPPAPLPNDVNEVLPHGRYCASRLGPLPPFDCRSGEIIPIKKNGVEIPYSTETTTFTKITEKFATCDKPVYLGLGGGQGQCVPYARLGRIDTGNPDVDTVFICRRYKAADCTDENHCIERGPQVPLHEDVAIVSHHRKTGETCYYQALGGTFPTARVPPPHEAELPNTVVSANAAEKEEKLKALAAPVFWLNPDAVRGFACIGCHDSDPFMHSPYVDQVKHVFPAGHPLAGQEDFMVPCDPAKPGQTSKNLCPKKDGQGKYSLVYKRHQPPLWPDSLNIKPKAADKQLCVSCHRLGSINTCQSWAVDAAGMRSHQHPSGVQLFGINNGKSDHGKKYPCSAWMPYFATNSASERGGPGACDPGDKVSDGATAFAPHPPIPPKTQEEWDSQFAASAKASLDCCSIFLQEGKTGTNFQNQCIAEVISTPPPKDNLLDLTLRPTDLTENALSIPDNKPSGRTLLLSKQRDSNAIIRQVDVTFSLEHEFIGDVKVILAHGQKEVTLFDGERLHSRGASISPSDPVPADSTFHFSASSLDPPADYQDTLKTFVSQAVRGPWYLKVYDLRPGESGKMHSFSAKVTYVE